MCNLQRWKHFRGRRMYTHTHSPTAHTYTHIGKDTRTHSPTHTHTQAALNVGHWALLSLKRAETVPKPLLQSDCFRTLKKTQFNDHNGLAISQSKTTAGHLYALKALTFPSKRQPPCFAYLNVASRWWGPGGLGRKNRRPTSHYDVQSCAIETVGRTILQVQ